MMTFAKFAAMPTTNKAAKREIRPAVLMRKASDGSVRVADVETPAILMSNHRTLKAQDIDPFAAMRIALISLAKTGSLPPLSDTNSSGG
jgi:hypothetical protein